MIGFKIPRIVKMILFRLNFTAFLVQKNTTNEYNPITINKMIISSPPMPFIMFLILIFKSQKYKFSNIEN